MTHNAPYLIQFYLLREPALGRKHRRVTGKIAEDKRSRQNAHREREPWLLASNLPAEQWTAAKVVAVYKRRMQIEESFQDGCISRPRIWRGYEGKPQEQTTILMLLSGCSWPFSACRPRLLLAALGQEPAAASRRFCPLRPATCPLQPVTD